MYEIITDNLFWEHVHTQIVGSGILQVFQYLSKMGKIAIAKDTMYIELDVETLLECIPL